jgi:hypothetical protein
VRSPGAGHLCPQQALETLVQIEPAVGVADARPVVVVHDGDRSRDRVIECGALAGTGTGGRHDEERGDCCSHAFNASP